eukprot:5058883-Pyramimonas_sp.AAC.1
MSAAIPPGFGLATAAAVGDLAGRRPEGHNQATHPPCGGDGQMGDVNPVPAPLSGSVPPDVTTASLLDLPAVAPDAQQGVLCQRDSDILDLLAGARPRAPTGPQS